MDDTAYMGSTVYEAAYMLIRKNEEKIVLLQGEIRQAKNRLVDPRFCGMLEAERIATRAERFLPPIEQGAGGVL